MTQPFRTERGGRVERDTIRHFRFNGRDYSGQRGDTLASALLANGVQFVGRSFKYHRPRGIFSIGSDEPSALLQTGSGPFTEPNTRATQAELHEGLIAASQNHWPSLRWDLLAVNDRLAPLLAAGFYYKTFMWPAAFWRGYEYFIRRAAGLGRAPTAPDPDQYEQRFAHCDVLVIGAGPAGLAAAEAAAQAGADVMLVDEHFRPGGWLCREQAQVGGMQGAEWAARGYARLSARDNVRVLLRTTAFGYYDHNLVALVERPGDHLSPVQRAANRQPRQRLWRVRARQVILATGAQEQPLIFGNNDLPGIMLAGAARGYVNEFGVRPGSVAVVLTNNDSAYRSAVDLHDAGVSVSAIVDLRPTADPALLAALELRRIRHLPNTGVMQAVGGRNLQAVEITGIRAGQWQSTVDEKLRCDLLCVSGGWAPTLHLHAQSGGKHRHDDALGVFVPDQAKQQSRCAGAVNGTWDLDACLNEGAQAGADAATNCDCRMESPSPPPVANLPGTGVAMMSVAPPPTRRKCFVDLQNDVTVDDIQLAHREGYRSVEHLKRYTTLGMGTDQGKTSNPGGLTLLAAERREPVPAVGTTTYRPPYTPVTLGTLAGEARDGRVAPVRRSPMHALHEKAGAVFVHNGLWLRPARFPLRGEKPADTVAREYRAVRHGIGLADISTLGKFEIRGPDCLEFLNRIYINAFTTETPGRIRYGVMLREDGMVLDDGTVTCVGPGHWRLTCSTAHAEEVRAHLEYLLDVLWPELRVHLVTVTEQWAGVVVAGPRARDWLQRLVTTGSGAPFAQLPHLHGAAGMVTGLAAQFLRVSYSGEYACEIYVRAGAGADLWPRLLAESAGEVITPYGLDAMDVLRIEKGYIAAGAEADGRTTPGDLGLQPLMKKNGRFVGWHGLQRPVLQRDNRLQLVGLLGADPKRPLREGAQIVSTAQAEGFGAAIGHVTSAAYSPGLGRYIALALLQRGHARHGEQVHLADPLRDGRKRRAAMVTAPVFLDPEGARLR